MTRLVTVHEGSLWEAQLLQGRLQDEAIQSYIPDAMVKQLDPFITGANPLAVRLQVTSAHAERALEVVKDYVRLTRQAPGIDPAKDDLTATDGDEGDTWKLGLRTRWMLLFTVFSPFLLPFALVMVVLYVRRAGKDASPPRGHRKTLLAALLLLPLGALTLGWWIWSLAS